MMWAATMYRIGVLVAGGANFVSEGEEKFLVVNVKHQAGGVGKKKAGVSQRRL